jgi:hypothetical protein
VDYNTPNPARPQLTFHLPSYGTLDGSVGYVASHFEAKLQVFNMLDTRTINSFVPGATTQSLQATTGFGGGPDSAIYSFQAGRQILLTLTGKH